MAVCAFVEWADGLEPSGPHWTAVRKAIDAARPDILVTNEMPFGGWLASVDTLDTQAAQRSVEVHEQGVAALRALGLPAAVSSRPVWAGDKLSNEAFALEPGRLSALHRKQMFPEEPGWHEATWFKPGNGDFTVHEIAGVRTGVLLCTELMFNERARHYGREGAELIVVPRATGVSQDQWFTAGAMAAIVSGAFVVSSNRSGHPDGGPEFGGQGFAFAPDGSLLATTSKDNALVTVELDLGVSRRQKAEYPCYVRES